MAKLNVTSPFASFLKTWPTKLAGGAKPSTECYEGVAALGVRGLKVGQALAMYLRPQGATNAEVVAVVSAPQRVLLGQLVKAKKLVTVDVDSRNGHQVYAVRLATDADKKPRGKKAKSKKAPAKAEAEAIQTAPVAE